MRTAFIFTLLFSTGILSFAHANTSFSPVTSLACNIPDGLLATDLGSGSATLTWNAVSGAILYTVEVEDEQNIPSTFHIETNVAGTSYTVSGLQTGVKYKFKVRTRCSSGKSEWSDWTFFGGSSGNGGSTGICPVVSGLSATVTDSTATLSWNAVNGISKYYIEVEDEQNTPSVFHLEDFSSTNSYTLTGLKAGVLYKFKVRTHCANGQSEWSTWVFFNGLGGTSGGGSGLCDAPAQLSASLNGTSATLSWNKVTGAAQYYVEVEDEQNVPSNFKVEVSVQDSFYVVTGLQPGVLYKFKVSAHCGTGHSLWSSWLFFNGATTGGTGGNTGGGTGTCATPVGLTATNISANSAQLAWDAVPGALSYTLEIERNQPGTAPWKMIQVATSNSFLLTGLSASTRYKFKVRSNCSDGGNSDWAVWLKFKTAANVTGSGNKSNLNQAAENRETVSNIAVVAFGVQIYPNPVKTTTTVQLQGMSAEPASLRLFDLSGHLVQEQHLQQDGGSWEGTLSLGHLPNGLYLLQVQNGQNTKTSKVVVQH